MSDQNYNTLSCERVARAELGAPVKKAGAELLYHCQGPAHKNGDQDPSLKVNPRKNAWGCFVCGVNGTPWSLAAFLAGLDANDTPGVTAWLKEHGQLNGDQRGKTKAKCACGPCVAKYVYTDAHGKPVARKLRFEPGAGGRKKDFSWQRFANGRWIDGLARMETPPYKLPEVLAAREFLDLEGEKDVATANSLGFTATTNAGAAGNWLDAHLETFRGKVVTIICDADPAGLKRGHERARLLAGVKDLTEWLELGDGDLSGAREQLLEIMAATPVWTAADIAKWDVSEADKPAPEALFHTIEDFENAPPLSFAIDGFLQNDGATLIGALAGHAKTWILLSMAKALFLGKGAKLWNYFDVQETAERVVYLIPESTIGPFGHRLRLMSLLDYVRNGRLLVRTLSKGPRPSLVDPRILAAVRGAHVMLDTLARFNEADDENSVAEFQALASNIFGMIAAGARSVSAAHHAPKSFEKGKRMTLEGVLRGTGDIGAMAATVWALRQVDPQRNIIHIENVKPRDFQPCGPFELRGRPSINEMGDFEMFKRPGECVSLEEMNSGERNKGGAPAEDREAKAARMNMLADWLKEDPNLTSIELVEKFSAHGIEVKDPTVRGYKRELEARKRRADL